MTLVKNSTIDNSSAVSNNKVSAKNTANAVMQNNSQSPIQNSKAEREHVQNDLASLFKYVKRHYKGIYVLLTM